MPSRRCWKGVCVLTAAVLWGAAAGRVSAGVMEADESPWSVSVGMGMINFEGDEDVKDAFFSSLNVGYDLSDHWTLEGALAAEPWLNENYQSDIWTGKRISRLEEDAGVDETSGVLVGLDALFHPLGRQRLDPFLTAGGGMVWYADNFDKQIEPLVGVGGGLLYRLSEQWALRADAKLLLAGVDTEFNLITTAGLCWRPAVRKPHRPMAVPEPARAASPAAAAPAVSADRDGDGLTDVEEIKLGTNPADQDSDHDGLTDREEIQVYHTNPMNPDTDWDGLTDGDEVHKYKTDPLLRDTDKGGVADGHEVIEDGTQPLVGSDDLKMFELDMNFAEGQSDVSPEYFSELDAIAKVIKADSQAKVRVEGHIDQQQKYTERSARQLTEKRAESIRDYLVRKGGIKSGSVTAVGYGFSRPKAANDPATGNPANRRMEIYIRASAPGGEAGEKVKVPAPDPSAK